MDKRQRKKFNKLLFNMLARNPARFRLIGDREGWIRIKDIHKALLEERLFHGLSPRSIEQHLMLFKPEGFEVSEGRARAFQGLQAPGIFDYEISRPPAVLFTPLRPRALIHVENSGLSCRDPGRWIILFSSRKEALLFGKRFHNNPVLCKVNALEASQAGVEFRHAGASLYLAKEIERHWLVLPQIQADSRAETEKESRLKERDQSETGAGAGDFREPGSFFPSVSAFEELFPKDAGFRKRKKGKYSKRFRKLDKKKGKK